MTTSVLLSTPLQANDSHLHLGHGLHTLGLLRWVLEQTGPADVSMTTFSTSEEFLCGFHRLRRNGLVKHAILVADVKAARKTVHLDTLVRNCFDELFLLPNHSKILIVKSRVLDVVVLTSQNHTYGDRAEQTFISTDPKLMHDAEVQLKLLTDKYNPILNKALAENVQI